MVLKLGITFVKIIFLLLIVFACKPERTKPEQKTSGIALGTVDERLAEASGLVASINNSGFLWTLNDSRNPAEIFLIDQHANTRLVVKLDHVLNRDWEDLAIDTGPDGKHYLYIADIGDNFLRYDHKLIYRFEEPRLELENKIYLTQFDTLIFWLPDGNFNAETILIDPVSHDVFMVSKVKGPSGLYRLPNPISQDTMMAEKIMSISLWEIVGGSISADGQQVLLKSYNAIYYWKKSGDESLQQLLSKPPIELPYQREPQGEAIAWARNGQEFYTLSESSNSKRANLIMQRIID